MHRRAFFTGAAALGALPLFSFETKGATRSSGLEITDIEIWRVEGNQERMRESTNRQYQVQPLHVYPENRPDVYRENRSPSAETAVSPTSRMYIKILTSEGVEGFYGPIDQNAVDVVLGELRRFVIGMDPLAIETIWDKMYRRQRHSRGGYYMIGMSAVDNCLWDLRGKFFDVPVYKLLGGSRNMVEVYGSCLGFSAELDIVGERSARLKKEGYVHQKWFQAYGPSSGGWGFEQNVGMVRTLRETLGEDSEIMFDAYMGWDLTYAMKWVKAVEQYHPRFLEEAVLPAKVESFARLRQMTHIPIATGETFYGRWEVNDFIQAGAIDVIQADPEWCGGVSELVKICILASTHDLVVIPHAHKLRAAIHVVASQPPTTCPMMEYLILNLPNFYYLERNPLVPNNGVIELPDLPGFGIELDESKIESMEKIS